MTTASPTLPLPSSGPPAPPLERARLPPRELVGVALQGLRTRKLRAALSALGIAIGIGAMVAVVGVSASAQANLLAEIDALGTNLLTVSPGQNFLGQNEVLPDTSVPMIGHMHDVLSDVAIYQLSQNVYRTPFVPSEQTGGIGVDAAGAGWASRRNSTAPDCRRTSCSEWRFRGCARASCERPCRPWGSRSGSARWSPWSAYRPPARPTCWR